MVQVTASDLCDKKPLTAPLHEGRPLFCGMQHKAIVKLTQAGIFFPGQSRECFLLHRITGKLAILRDEPRFESGFMLAKMKQIPPA